MSLDDSFYVVPLQEAVVNALNLEERTLVVEWLNRLAWHDIPVATLDNLHTFEVAYMAYALGTAYGSPHTRSISQRAMREISRLQQMADRGEL